INSTPTEVKIDNFVLDGTVNVDRNGQFSLSVQNVDGKVSVDIADFPVPLLSLFQGVIHKAIGDSVARLAPRVLQKSLAGQSGDIPIPLPWASSKPPSIHYALGGLSVARGGLTADVHTTFPNAPQFSKPIDPVVPGDG